MGTAGRVRGRMWRSARLGPAAGRWRQWENIAVTIKVCTQDLGDCFSSSFWQLLGIYTDMPVELFGSLKEKIDPSPFPEASSYYFLSKARSRNSLGRREVGLPPGQLQVVKEQD